MGLKADLVSTVSTIFRSVWTERNGLVVPGDSSVTLGNDAVKIEATVLYADLADSTAMVDRMPKQYSAEVYKSFLHCAAKIITNQNGSIAAYDGDRIMAVFIGGSKNTDAVRAALMIKYAVNEILNPAKKVQYTHLADPIKYSIGIDSSDLLVAKTGVRGANDLVWVGRAANHAAKLSTLSSSYVYITKDVYEHTNADLKFTDGASMWDQIGWHTFDGRVIYRSNWQYRID